MIAGLPAEHGSAVLAVGDDDQSIYAFRRLISGIEDLRFSHLRDAKLKCQDKYCRWREIDISDDKPIEMCCGHSGFGILSNSLAFEIKLTNVSEDEYRLKKLLKGDYDKERAFCKIVFLSVY